MTPVTRRLFLGACAASHAIAAGSLPRRRIVSRHNPEVRAMDPRAPLSVGNGEFAFTVDVTGLQSFPAEYVEIPLCTQSQWGWHSFPLNGLDPARFRLEMFEVNGRQVGYATSAKGQEPLYNWLRENPHRLNLARVGLLLDGAPLAATEVGAVEQRLDLWSGVIESRFRLRGEAVAVLTCCHPSLDAVAIRLEGTLVNAGRLTVAFDFPYGSPGISAADWDSPESHSTTLEPHGANAAEVSLRLDADQYYARLFWSGPASVQKSGPHRVALAGSRLEFVCEFLPTRATWAPLNFDSVHAASVSHWERFWSSGASMDLSGATDPRAAELERRIVLSQYLTAIQCSGSMPPQETGLTCNSWYGKFHLEMHWWHAAHFALWGRAPMLERSLAWYQRILPAARRAAERQGYAGARWPKMTAADGRSSPSNIGELLIWQQPHPIALSELCYRANPRRRTLERYAPLVLATAEFLVSFAVKRNGRWQLGPPVIPAQENHPPRETWNPTFELQYWREALAVAQRWRQRLGLPAVPLWDDVNRNLAPLPMKDGVYLAHENCPRTFEDRNRDHPSMLAALGVLQGVGVDREAMRGTLHRTLKEWHWEDTWGWDFPMTAMTAARLGEPATAIGALFMESPKNTWLPNGHNWQNSSLPLYLPGNGGLLAAVAMMASAWNGFPHDWNIKHEGVKALL